MLIIYAHPNKRGHSGFILKSIEQELKKRNYYNYKIIDLYQDNYDPVLKEEEHYTSGGRQVSEKNKEIQEIIKNEDKFIFIYPTWWNNMPAILKGFIDRIITPGFAFRYQNKIPLPMLKGRAIIFSSTGTPRILTRFYYKDNSIKALSRDVLNFSGIKSKGIIIDKALVLSLKQKSKILKRVKKGINYLI